MKHGDKKQKTAKAITKASGKKTSAARHAGSSDSKPKKVGAIAGGKAAARPVPVAEKTVSEKSGKRKAAGVPGELTFNNALVGSAFKHAIKKYPLALKRLVD